MKGRLSGLREWAPREKAVVEGCAWWGDRILVRRGPPSHIHWGVAIRGTTMAVTGSLLGHWYTRPYK